jgi:TrmH family RNA methyltransferase
MAKYRRQEAVFLAEGMKVVQELFNSPWKAAAVMVLEGRERRWESILAGMPYPVDAYLLSEGEWKGVSQDKEPEGIMAQVMMKGCLKAGLPTGGIQGHLLLAHRISNPNNLGALMRTAHWFGIKTVMVSENSVDITHPKVVRSAMGSLFHLNILEEMDFMSLIPALKDSRLIIGSDPARGMPPRALTREAALILGNESHGLPAALQPFMDEWWCIPCACGAESLSLPQAAAIMIYELTRQDKGR